MLSIEKTITITFYVAYVDQIKRKKGKSAVKRVIISIHNPKHKYMESEKSDSGNSMALVSVTNFQFILKVLPYIGLTMD